MLLKADIHHRRHAGRDPASSQSRQAKDAIVSGTVKNYMFLVHLFLDTGIRRYDGQERK